MPFDAQGVWVYSETDTFADESEKLNQLGDSVSTGLAQIRDDAGAELLTGRAVNPFPTKTNMTAASAVGTTAVDVASIVINQPEPESQRPWAVEGNAKCHMDQSGTTATSAGLLCVIESIDAVTIYARWEDRRVHANSDESHHAHVQARIPGTVSSVRVRASIVRRSGTDTLSIPVDANTNYLDTLVWTCA